MKTPGVCQSCGKEAPIAFAQFRKVTGLLMVSMTRSSSGMLCEKCACKRFIFATIHNVFLGWWSGPSMIATPVILVSNWLELNRLSRQYSAPEDARNSTANWDAEARRRLPWAPLIGVKPAVADIGHKALTLPMGIAALAAMVFFVSLLGVVVLSITDGNNPPQEAA